MAIGISTGGPQALHYVLSQLPADFPGTILIVQHMPPGFTATFAQRLATICAVAVREASSGDRIEPGVVYIAPAGKHMKVDRASERGVIRLDSQPDHYLHIPSIDVMMESRFPEDVRRGLERRGHEIDLQGEFSNMVGGGQAVMHDARARVNYGGSDPRKDGAAIPEPIL